MSERPEDTIRRITDLLDERVPLAEGEESALFHRVLDVVNGFDMWCDLAVQRLHEIHRLRDQECEFCSKYLDDSDAP